uniref:Uncharacterized protein n=1 Tax=Arundo donax TaxID=35708 RepID=A0A0A9GIB8_ARUDO
MYTHESRNRTKSLYNFFDITPETTGKNSSWREGRTE